MKALLDIMATWGATSAHVNINSAGVNLTMWRRRHDVLETRAVLVPNAAIEQPQLDIDAEFRKEFVE